ncbi:unnamed protein product [Diatraea saccharalis]|uniref:Cadherin domain-containing protein n=1 Tax=Diatraea saccharalis TaxID=40085 RepID=A0A9N9QVS6_9NEOP|nr:unnamed protein product [Diatraea saccharalis]
MPKRTKNTRYLLHTKLLPEGLIFLKRAPLNSGIENNPTVFYRLMPGSTAQTNKFHTFYLQQRADNGFTWADIKVNHPLDYESIKEYNLTIRVENNGAQQLASEATVYIMLEDVNDEIPLFTEREQETVLEGEPIGTKVTQVNAIDKDGTFPNNQYYFGCRALLPCTPFSAAPLFDARSSTLKRTDDAQRTQSPKTERLCSIGGYIIRIVMNDHRPYLIESLMARTLRGQLAYK